MKELSDLAAGAAWEGGPAKNKGGIESRNSSLTPISPISDPDFVDPDFVLLGTQVVRLNRKTHDRSYRRRHHRVGL